MITCALAIARASPAASTGLSGRPLTVAALICWLLTASIGAYMLHTWVTSGGLRAQRATGVGVPPAVVFGHAAAALAGLAAWVSYLSTDWIALAWLGVGLITAAVALGVCTVTLWTPYPIAIPEAAHEPTPGARDDPAAFEVTDEMIARLLANPFPGPRRPRLRLGSLIPVGHGFAALATFMLATLATISGTLGMVRAQ
jgi:hypothetical protein